MTLRLPRWEPSALREPTRSMGGSAAGARPKRRRNARHAMHGVLCPLHSHKGWQVRVRLHDSRPQGGRHGGRYRGHQQRIGLRVPARSLGVEELLVLDCMSLDTSRPSGPKVDAKCTVSCCAGLLRGVTEDVFPPRNLEVDETGVRDDGLQLCFQQSTGDSAGP